MTKIVIIGAGGFAREVLDVVEACIGAGADLDPVGFIVDREFGEPGLVINDKPVLGDFSWLSEHVSEVAVVCAIGAPELRRKLVKRAEAIGCKFATLIHPSTILTRWINIGEGSIIPAGCILTNNIILGTHIQLNLGCTIGHDSILADFVTLAPGVHVSGNVRLEEGAYIGTGVNIIEKVSIGNWSIIGAGSVVVKDIEANVTAVGLPARIIKQREPGWHER